MDDYVHLVRLLILSFARAWDTYELTIGDLFSL
jgi:hypothetical protein